MKFFLPLLLILFFIFSFSFFPNILLEDNNLQSNQVIIENITLLDNEFYPKKIGSKTDTLIISDIIGQTSEIWDFLFYNWVGYVDINKNHFPNENPIVLRSLEQDDYATFEDVKSVSISGLTDLSFPADYEVNGRNKNIEEVLGINIYKNYHDDDFLKYINLIFQSKVCRNALFQYYIKVFNNIQKKYPNTWKQHYVNVIDNSLGFLKKYNLNRKNYVYNINNKCYNIDQVIDVVGNRYNAFLFRRIENNKIPLIELNNYLIQLKELLVNSIKQSNYTNYKNLIVNNGDIIVSDSEVSGEGLKVKIWNKKSKNVVFIENFLGIKCLKNGNQNYYLIFNYDDFSSIDNTLIDNNIKVLNKTKINQIENNNTEYISISNEENIKMKNKNGVYYIPTEVNGYPMEFVFDTGASTVSISIAEAMLLYKNGKLQKTDILGSQYFSDANGDISEGTKIILRKIKIGNKILNNIEASVVHNLEAPLLLGQSAIKKLGKYTFDTNNNMLIFKKD